MKAFLVVRGRPYGILPRRLRLSPVTIKVLFTKELTHQQPPIQVTALEPSQTGPFLGDASVSLSFELIDVTRPM